MRGVCPGNECADTGAESGVHGIRYVVVGDEAAGADAGSDSSENPGRVSTVELVESGGSEGGDISGGATPTGMECCDCVYIGSVEQDGYAIGGVYDERSPWLIGDKAVTFPVYQAGEVFSGVVFACYADDVAVNLVGRNHCFWVVIEGICQNQVVFIYILHGIVFVVEVHTGLCAGADAAESGGKCVFYRQIVEDVADCQWHFLEVLSGELGFVLKVVLEVIWDEIMCFRHEITPVRGCCWNFQ